MDPTKPREDSGSEPPASVRRALVECGSTEVSLPGRAGFWRSASGEVTSWEDSLDALVGELKKRRALDTLGAKHFLKTSEFWVALTTLLGILGTLATVLMGWGTTLNEPYREMVMGALGLAAAFIPRGYRFARERAKMLAEVEKQKAMSPAG